jgi:hypothetical protein
MPRYNDVVVAATHNSYSGDARGSIPHQLDHGVRFVELDVHDNDFEANGYRIGHGEPGAEVSHLPGNPASNRLADWLDVVARWSDGHRPHAPIVVALDLKDPLTDNRSFAAGNLAHLNAVLAAHLPRLLPPVAAWGELETVRDRVIVVLSGHHPTRQAYLRDPAHNPAVAIDTRGRIVEVHDSGSGDLWYWTGEFVSPTEVRWHRHGWYDTGQLPAVALDASGRVVEVHQRPDGEQLYYRLGRLNAEFELEWTQAKGRPFPNNDGGRGPTVRFAGGDRVRELHQGSTGQHWYWNGTLSGGALTWSRSDSGRTNDPLFAKTRDGAGRNSISVSTGSSGGFGSDTLLSSAGRIRYEQLAFVEVQPGNDAIERDGAWFFAAASDSGRAWATERRRRGKLVRLWDFDSVARIDPPASFGATNHPDAQWYRDYLTSVGAVA